MSAKHYAGHRGSPYGIEMWQSFWHLLFVAIPALLTNTLTCLSIAGHRPTVPEATHRPAGCLAPAQLPLSTAALDPPLAPGSSSGVAVVYTGPLCWQVGAAGACSPRWQGRGLSSSSSRPGSDVLLQLSFCPAHSAPAPGSTPQIRYTSSLSIK